MIPGAARRVAAGSALLAALSVAGVGPLSLAARAPAPTVLASAGAVPLAVPRPAADPPLPPPPDLARLPSGTPARLAGVRQIYSCTKADRPPTSTSLTRQLWGQRLLRLPELWSAGRGRAVRIAVIDTGVSRHPLLADRLIDGGDFVNGRDGLTDCDGHGTAVAGIAAAALDAGSTFAGVAPAAEIISIRQTSIMFTTSPKDDVHNSAGNLRTLAQAVVHATELGADVINISTVACQPPNVAGAAELRAAIHHAVQRDVVVVAAAGNTGADQRSPCPRQQNGAVVYPAWFDDDVLTVASAGPGGLASDFSYPGPWVDVAAPGEHLVSLAATGPGLTDQLQGADQSIDLNGTSFAAPAVAGLAALIRGRYPKLTAAQIVDRITATAAQRSAGRSDTVGYGMVDPVAALNQPPEVLTPPGADADGDTGTLDLRPAARPAPAGPGALWGGTLALLATVAAGALAVSKRRTGWRGPP